MFIECFVEEYRTILYVCPRLLLAGSGKACFVAEDQGMIKAEQSRSSSKSTDKDCPSYRHGDHPLAAFDECRVLAFRSGTYREVRDFRCLTIAKSLLTCRGKVSSIPAIASIDPRLIMAVVMPNFARKALATGITIVAVFCCGRSEVSHDRTAPGRRL